MRYKPYFLSIGLVSLIIAGALVWKHQRAIPEVDVFEVHRGTVEFTVSSTTAGTVLSRQEATLSSLRIGTVTDIKVSEGQTVEGGEVLIILDSTEAEAQLDLAKANLEAGGAQLRQAKDALKIQETVGETSFNQAELGMEQAADDFNRQKSLYESGVISKDMLDRAEKQFKIAQEQHTAAYTRDIQTRIKNEDETAAQANVKQLEAQVALAQENLDRCVIKSPFRGVVSDIMVDKGELVTLGKPLCHMIDNVGLYIEAYVDEVDSSRLETGMPVRIMLDAYPEKKFSGTLGYIAPNVALTREQSRAVKIEVVPNLEEATYRVGMSADVFILIDKHDSVLFVPTNAVYTLGGRDTVFVVSARGILEQRALEAGLSNWIVSEVASGFEEGDLVVLDPNNQLLVSGSRVRIKQVISEMEALR